MGIPQSGLLRTLFPREKTSNHDNVKSRSHGFPGQDNPCFADISLPRKTEDMKRILTLIILIAGTATAARAQRISIEGNLADAALLGTMNAKAGIRMSEHWALGAGFRYNPWSFREDSDPRAFQDRRRTFYAGPERRPADSCGGIWMAARLQYEEYNRGGLFGRPATEEGEAWGLSFGGGYSFRLRQNLRLDTGLLFWGGVTDYVSYARPRCGRCLTADGCKGFLRYDGAVISLVYNFDLRRNYEKD